MEQKVRDQARTMGLDEDTAVAQAFKPKSFFDIPMPTIFSRANSSPNNLTTTMLTEGIASPEGGLPAEETEAESTSPQVMDMKLVVSLFQAAALVFIGTVIMIAAVFTTNSSLPIFLTVLAIGTLILMGTTAGINLAMMAAVPPESRSFAIGLGTLMLHALGDVPAPPIIGAMADKLSPNICDANNNCHRDHSGLVDTLLATASWLVWPVFFWTLAYILAVRRQSFRRRTGFYRLFSSTPAGGDRDAPPAYVAPSRSPPNFTNTSGTSYGIGMPLPRIASSRYEDSSLNLGISISSSLANTNYLTDNPGLEMKAPSRPNSGTHSATTYS
jgi:MFS family permease